MFSFIYNHPWLVSSKRKGLGTVEHDNQRLEKKGDLDKYGGIFSKQLDL